jgi:hypothetical protein
VFRVSAGLGKIGIRGLQQWVLIAMSKLTLHGAVASRLLGPILLYGAFTAVLVIGESRVQIVSGSSHWSILVPGRGNASAQYHSLSENFYQWEGLIL